MRSKGLKDLFDTISSQKKVSIESIKESLENIIERVYLKKIDAEAEVKAEMNEKTGDVKLFVKKEIVDEITDEYSQILSTSEEAEGYEVGQTEFIEISLDVLPKNTFVQVKQMFRQNLKEQEEKYIYEKYNPLVGTIIRAKIYRVGNGLLCNLEDATAFMQKSEFSRSDDYKVGNYMDFYILSVDEMAKDSQVKLSRSNPELLRSVISSQIDDVKDGVIIVHDIARIAGERAKISVSSTLNEIDPIGGVIGPKGSLIKKITNAVGGEKIDVIKYCKDEEEYIMEALSPATVKGIKIRKEITKDANTGEEFEGRYATVVVADDDLVQAIGKAGTNVKLAVKLTGFNIDIKSETEAKKEGLEYKEIVALNNYSNDSELETSEIVEYDDLLNIMEEFDLNKEDNQSPSENKDIGDAYDFDETEIY